MTRALAAVLTLTFLLALPVAASGHESARVYSSSMAGYFGQGDAVGMLGRSGMADPQPLEGVGENMRIVANVPLGDGSGSVAGSDIELAGDYAFVGSYGEGMVVIDISNPREPKRAGVFPCQGGGQFDVQLQPGSKPKYAVMAIESTSNGCHRGDEGFVLIDISDPAQPKEVAFVGQAVGEGGLQDGSHNTTMDWPYLYNDQYQPTHGNQQGNRGQLDVFDLREVAKGNLEPLSVLPIPGGAFHDLQVDHRPDGKVIGYAASIGFTDELDLSNPADPKLLNRYAAPEHGVGISHGIEPNHDRTLALESDEYGGGSGVGACGGSGAADPSGGLPPGAALIDNKSAGALHFLKLDTEGETAGQLSTLTPGKLDEAGAFNIAPSANDTPNEGCTAHVFWQAPDENRLVIAWYGRGTRIVDFSDPANPKELGHFIPKGSETWSAKPHKGYIFTGDTVRGMDVLEYTGEDCGRWPTTSGAAEVQRDRYQGSAFKVGGLSRTDAIASTPAGCGGKPPTGSASGGGSGGSGSAGGGSGATPAGPTAAQPGPGGTPAPSGSANDARVGGYRFARTVPRSSRRRTVRLEIRNRAGRRLATLGYRQPARRRGILRASVGGPVGRYSYRIVAGRRVLKRGAFTIKTSSRTRVRGATATKLRVVRRSR